MSLVSSEEATREHSLALPDFLQLKKVHRGTRSLILSGLSRLEREPVPPLLHRLLTVAMMSSGAGRGLLFVANAGRLSLRAEQSDPDREPSIRAGDQLEIHSPPYSEMALMYTVRTLEPLALHNAAEASLLYHMQRFANASRKFARVLTINPWDRTVEVHLERATSRNLASSSYPRSRASGEDAED